MLVITLFNSVSLLLGIIRISDKTKESWCLFFVACLYVSSIRLRQPSETKLYLIVVAVLSFLLEPSPPEESSNLVSNTLTDIWCKRRVA